MNIYFTRKHHSIRPFDNRFGASRDCPRRSVSKHTVIAMAVAGIGGCNSISIPASPSEQLRAAQLPIYMAPQAGAASLVRADLGPVEGYSCNPQRDFPPDANVQRSGALEQLRLRALKSGADGVFDVRFSPIQTDRRNACFHGMAARGEAVAFSGR